MTKVPAEFTSHNEEEFGNLLKVSSSLLRSYACNDEYLKQEVDDLWDSTDPELRKRFTPLLIDDPRSYGVILDNGLNAFKFNDNTGFDRNDSFDTLDNIELAKSTARVDTVSGKITMQPQKGTEVENTKCPGPWGAYRSNAYWYISYDRTKPYITPPSAIANPLNANIPSVARAQTFTAAANGILSKISLNLHGSNLAEDKLYVEIRTTSGGKPTSTVLTREEVQFKKQSNGGIYVIPFSHPITLVSGTKYAIVVRSPFTTYGRHYGIGGWGKNCKADPCPNGDAFLSVDNAKTWIKHGRDEKVPYKEGKYAPQDFAFLIHTIPLTLTYSYTNEEVIYLKPIRTNPITRIVLSATFVANGGTCIFEVSTNGRDWSPCNSGNGYTVTPTAPYKRVLYVRIRLLAASPGTSTPEVSQLNIHLDTNPATEGYLRTLPYSPKMGGMLGANIWSRVHGPVTIQPNTNVLVDIIRDIENTDYFVTDGNTATFTLDTLPAYPLEYVKLSKTSDGTFVEYLEDIDFTVDYATGAITFYSNPVAGDLSVYYYPVWIKGLTQEELPIKTDLFIENLAVVGTQTVFDLRVIPVDPIRKVLLINDDGDEVELIEGVDFNVDYLAKTLTLVRSYTDDTYTLEIHYTPFLNDTGLILAYNMSRSNTSNQAYVEGNYFQVRV